VSELSLVLFCSFSFLHHTFCKTYLVVILINSQMVPLEVFIDIKSFRSHYGPGVDSASNINEYQEYFLRVKAAGV